MKRIISSAILLLLSTLLCQAQTWYKANNPFGGNILEINQTGDGDLLCGTTRGLYKSTDMGENWQSISDGFENLPSPDAKSTPSGMYIAMFSNILRRSFNKGQSWETIPAQNWTSFNIIVVNDSGQILINTNNSVWRSSDNGDSWTQLSIASNVSVLASLEISPDGELFAGSFNKKIYRSKDNGDSWTELFVTANDIRSFGFDGDSVIYATTLFNGMYKSVDNGDNWSLLPALPGTNGALDLEVNDSGEIFAAAFDDGVLKSTDGGMSWQDISTDLIDPSARKIFLNNNQDLFIGTEAAGVQKHLGSTWTPKNQGISAIVIERFIPVDSLLYACTSNGVFVSSDGGQSWQQSVKGMDETDILALAKAPNGDLYAGGEMLYYSTDGQNWNDISQGFPDSEVSATDIVIDSTGRVIVATDDYGIRFTDNQGQSWTNANSGLVDVTMNFIQRSSDGYFFTADGYNLYRSNDLSGSWDKINMGMGDPNDVDVTGFGMGDSTLFAITFSDGLFKSSDNGDNWVLSIDEDFSNLTTNGDEVYGASESVVDGGVYFSSDDGGTWNNIGNGLPSIQVEAVNYVQGQGLFANVRAFGLYTLDFSVLGVEDPLGEKIRINSYPNPFSSVATLSFELEKRAELSFSIYGLNGQLVERFTPLQLSQGRHEIQIGEKLPAGIYFVRLAIGNFSTALRLVKTN